MRTNTFKYLQCRCNPRGFSVERSGRYIIVNPNQHPMSPQRFNTVKDANEYVERTPISKYIRALWDIRLQISHGRNSLSDNEKECLRMLNEVLI